jgi:AcrR family transcriptional regulator
MPRHADPELERRVLDAAQALWRSGGDKRLSMRVLARAARTNTPAIYRRFKNREGILRALLLRLRQELYEVVRTSASLEEACERYLDFALARPQEYQLYHAHYHELLGASPAAQKAQEFGPSFLWVQSKLAERVRGDDEQHLRLTLALWALAHGTAMLLISSAMPDHLQGELRSTCTQAVASLVREAGGR